MPGLDDIINDKKPLPLFRRDLEKYEGPDNQDGSPTFNLLDPIRARYFKISWEESLIMQFAKPGITIPELLEQIHASTPLRLTKEDIRDFYIDALRQSLLVLPQSSESLTREAKLRTPGWFKWLLFHYLYFRVPLINPDKFLQKTLHYVSPLFSKPAIILYICAGLAGLVLLISQFDIYIHTFTYFFNWQGAVIYAIAIICVKLIHEFSHAYVAKKMNVRVPTMGVALIVLWPVLYTDVTDGWKLASRRKRIAISIAGIAAELVVAGLCTIGWAFSEPGLTQSIFFVISSVTWVSTLVINLNPAVRFDGYYILSDLWKIDNLQLRSFDYTRWLFRKVFFGFDLPSPEEDLPKKDKALLVVYCCYTWVYRIFLYIGIALFVYYQFTKVLGIFLFLMEVGVFILWPISSEIYELGKMRKHFSMNTRTIATLTVVALALLWFILPWPRQESFVALTAPIEEQTIYMPENGLIQQVNVKRGQQLQKGDVLAQVVSPGLNEKIIAKQADEKVAEAQVEDFSHGEAERPYIAEKKAELATIREELGSLLAKRDSMRLKAELSGTLFDWGELIKQGVFLEKDTPLGKIADTKVLKVVCFVPEDLLDTIHVGQKAEFILDSTHDKFSGVISSIEPSRTTNLRYPQLASINGGDLAVAESYIERGFRGTEKPGNKYRSAPYALIDAYYEVTIMLNGKSEKDQQRIDELRFGMKGEVQVRGPWRSKLVQLLQRITTIFWRESGL
jgi:putative peptide zinc metalloprotease protein